MEYLDFFSPDGLNLLPLYANKFTGAAVSQVLFTQAETCVCVWVGVCEGVCGLGVGAVRNEV